MPLPCRSLVPLLVFALVLDFITPVAASEAERCAAGPVVSEAIGEESPFSAPAPQSAVTVASLNMAGQMGIVDELAAWMNERAIDVLFLQEVGQEHGDGAAFMASLRERLRLAYVYAPATPFETGHMQGLAIVSRYPLGDLSVRQLEYNQLRFRSRCRIALAATVSTPEGSIRVTNVHLDTRINSSRRVDQLMPAVEALDAFEGPQIIGGDFNTMDVGWLNSMWPMPLAQHQAKAVREELSKVGFDTPFGSDTRPTFKFLRLPIKLDWLYFRQVATGESGVDDVPLSDHRGIWTRTSLDP